MSKSEVHDVPVKFSPVAMLLRELSRGSV